MKNCGVCLFELFVFYLRWFGKYISVESDCQNLILFLPVHFKYIVGVMLDKYDKEPFDLSSWAIWFYVF